jgi:hypothetical protein
MSTNVPSPPKDDLLSKIWSICSTLTEEAFIAATAKAKEMNFDQSRGVIPLQESFINLSSARFILEDDRQAKTRSATDHSPKGDSCQSRANREVTSKPHGGHR